VHCRTSDLGLLLDFLTDQSSVQKICLLLTLRLMGKGMLIQALCSSAAHTVVPPAQMVATADGRLVVLGGRTFVNSEAIVRPITRWPQALLLGAGYTSSDPARAPAGFGINADIAIKPSVLCHTGIPLCSLTEQARSCHLHVSSGRVAIQLH